MLSSPNTTELYELSRPSGQRDEQGALVDSSPTPQDTYALAYRRRQAERYSIRFCLCLLFLSAMLLTLIIVLFSSLMYRQHHDLSHLDDDVEIEVVWTAGFPKLITESAFRLVDCNSDGILDVIFGFGTGIDSLETQQLLCDLYFNGISPCNGGVKALDGRNGQVLWSYDKSNHEVFALNCQRDIDGDGVPDCITGGRGGTMEAINGRSGALIWTFNNAVRSTTMNFYTPLYLNKDYDGDGLPDMVTVHGGDPTRNPHEKVRLAGELLLISSRTGKLLNVSIVPDRMESYYSPQLLRRSPSEEFILIGTGGETHGGGLYAFDLNCFTRSCSSSYVEIITDAFKGVMTPPVLIDVNRDQVEDIIIPLYNSRLFAFDGRTFRPLWNRTFPSSETYSSPAVGYFNDDDTPDIMIHYQMGPGYPLYYSAQTTILDGLTGVPLLDRSIEQTVGAQSSPLTISFKHRGNDMFIYWMGECDETDKNIQRKIDYNKNTPSALLSHADICKLRYQTTSFSALHGLSSAMKPPGIQIYNSNQYVALERSTTNAKPLDVEQFLRKYPNYSSTYDAWRRLDDFMEGKTITKGPVPADEDDAESDEQFSRKLFKRHIGPHDVGGLQRTISTGTLAPSFKLDSNSTIDLIFATYWIHSDTSAVLHADERTCIDEGMAKEEEERLNSRQGFAFGMDHDAYEHYVEDRCTNKTRLYDTVLKISPELIDHIRASMANPFKKQLGQLTVYRLRLHFRKKNCDFADASQCEVIKENDDLQPFDKQIWPAYMGKQGDCHANVHPVPVGGFL